MKISKSIKKSIHQCKEQWNRIQVLGRRTIEESLSLGKQLTDLKAEAGHGNWTKICGEIGINNRQAQRLMKAHLTAPEDLENVTFSELIGPVKNDNLSYLDEPKQEEIKITDPETQSEDQVEVGEGGGASSLEPSSTDEEEEIKVPATYISADGQGPQESIEEEPEPEESEKKEAPFKATTTEERTIKNDPVAKAYHDIYQESLEYENIASFRVWLKKELDKLLEGEIKIVDSRVSDIRDAFLEEYNGNYYWAAKDGKAAKEIIKKLEFVAKERDRILDGEGIVNAFRWLMKNADPWIQERMSMTLINSKFNEIINAKRKTTKAKDLSGADIESLARAMAGE